MLLYKKLIDLQPMLFILINQYQLSYQQTATLLHVSVATINVWKQKNQSPKWANLLLKRKLNATIEFPNLINPAECLKRVRKSRKLKNKQLAQFIGVETRLIADW